MIATRFTSALVNRALVATTAMVVLPAGRGATAAAERAGDQQRPDVGQRLAVFRPQPRHQLAVGRVHDVADRVDGRDGADHEPVRQRDAGGADAALHRPLRVAHLADRCAGAGADVALGDRPAAAAVAARYPQSAVGRTFGSPPNPRSIRIAAGTIGTTPAAPTFQPILRSSR